MKIKILLTLPFLVLLCSCEWYKKGNLQPGDCIYVYTYGHEPPVKAEYITYRLQDSTFHYVINGKAVHTKKHFINIRKCEEGEVIDDNM